MTGDSNALNNKRWQAVDSMYMQRRYTWCEPAQQHTMHGMANGTRSGSSTRNRSRKYGGSSGCTDQNPSTRFQGSSSHNDHQNSSASRHGTHSNENGQQQHQSVGNNGCNMSSDGQQMSDCNDDDDEPRSPHWRTGILNNCSHSSSLNIQGRVMTHPARYLCLTDNF